jgi:hypothetical protein
MEPALLAVLKEALAKQQRKETLERAVGRAVRGDNLDFEIYLKIMSELRGLSKKEHKDPEVIARALVSEHQKNH